MTGLATRPGRGRRRTLTILLTLTSLGAVLAVARTRAGLVYVDMMREFLEYYVGVFALLALTGAVVWGLSAAERVMPPRGRVLAQATHRASASAGVAFLAAHITLKVLEGHASAADAVVPLAGAGGYVALGTLATDLILFAFVSGLLRGRGSPTGRVWPWRAVHCAAYAAWPMAIAHGLMAGRTPKAWVTWSYIVCAALVALAAAVRVFTSRRKRPMAAPAARRRPARQPPARETPSRQTQARHARHQSPADGVEDGGDAADAAFWESLLAERSRDGGVRR